MRYLYIRLINFDKIWYDDVHWPSQPGQAKIWKVENARWRMAAIVDIEETWYLSNHSANFDEIMRDDTY